MSALVTVLGEWTRIGCSAGPHPSLAWVVGYDRSSVLTNELSPSSAPQSHRLVKLWLNSRVGSEFSYSEGRSLLPAVLSEVSDTLKKATHCAVQTVGPRPEGLPQDIGAWADSVATAASRLRQELLVWAASPQREEGHVQRMRGLLAAVRSPALMPLYPLPAYDDVIGPHYTIEGSVFRRKSYAGDPAAILDMAMSSDTGSWAISNIVTALPGIAWRIVPLKSGMAEDDTGPAVPEDLEGALADPASTAEILSSVATGCRWVAEACRRWREVAQKKGVTEPEFIWG